MFALYPPLSLSSPLSRKSACLLGQVLMYILPRVVYVILFILPVYTVVVRTYDVRSMFMCMYAHDLSSAARGTFWSWLWRTFTWYSLAWMLLASFDVGWRAPICHSWQKKKEAWTANSTLTPKTVSEKKLRHTRRIYRKDHRSIPTFTYYVINYLDISAAQIHSIIPVMMYLVWSGSCFRVGGE